MGVSRQSVHAWLYPTGPAPGAWPTACAKSAEIRGRSRVVGTSYWAHHMAMNEFADRGQNPRLSRAQRDEVIREARDQAKRPPPKSARFPAQVQVGVAWDAEISSSGVRWLRQAERDLFPALVSPDPATRKVWDCTLSNRDGFVVDSPAQPQIAVYKTDVAIYMLLGREPRWADRKPPLIPAAPAWPDTPVRVRIVWDAGIRPTVVRDLGQAERDLFRALLHQDPGARKVLDVQGGNFTLSTGAGFVVDSPELPHIAVGKTADAINVLLVPAGTDPFTLRPYQDIRPYHDMGPGSPVRKPGSDLGP